MSPRSIPDIYRACFDASPVGMFVHDQYGVIKSANAAGAGVLGLEATALPDKDFSRYITPDSQHAFSGYLKRLGVQNAPDSCDVRLVQRHKPLFNATLQGIPLRAVPSGDVRFLMMLTGIKGDQNSGTAVSAASGDSISAGLMDVMLVSNLNQPLAVIGNYIYGCINRLGCRDFRVQDILKAMQQAEHELHRLAEMILRMRNFSYRKIFQYEQTEIDLLIRDVLSILNHEVAAYPVCVDYRPAKGLPKIMLDKLYIQQAILNLARNAIDAMQDAEWPDPRLTIEVNRLTMEMFQISLSDNGPAFRATAAHRLFEPDYTTKPYGVGLGLAASRIIIEKHGGRLLAELNPAGGACFRIELPLACGAGPG